MIFFLFFSLPKQADAYGNLPGELGREEKRDTYIHERIYAEIIVTGVHQTARHITDTVPVVTIAK